MTKRSLQLLERDDGFAQNIHTQLRQALMRGRLPPGERLVHRVLTTNFKGSPTPAREAVRRLAAESALSIDQRGVAAVRIGSSRQGRDAMARDIENGARRF